MTTLYAFRHSRTPVVKSMVINARFLESVALPKVGSICLRGILGDPVEADLVSLNRLIDLSGPQIPIVCAVCPRLNEDMILTVNAVSHLRELISVAPPRFRLKSEKCLRIIWKSAQLTVSGVEQISPAENVPDDTGDEETVSVNVRSADADTLIKNRKRTKV